ncbi:hypothetical protein [Spiroplasma floricola]|uniref:Uncharacterized protein n=1 Tax=Spiroplasma floricola 23-6 TaxID=1336749 RepID=A0A2K8SF02_9MOLU|nr:hypothetical protein [Spiroplasma floricola]AUB31420.1 hypothetical protein SFLOR_v1c03630 [Spiroplasma floricola 23-6]
MLKEIINKDENNLVFSKIVNEKEIVNFKDIIYNFLNQPQIKIEQKYDLLFSKAIKKNCFKDLVKELESDFKTNFVLWKLTEKISYWTTMFFSSKFKNGNGFKLLQKIFILKQVFLAQLRYNSNIWLKLSPNQTLKIKSKKKETEINYKLLLLMYDFNESEEDFFILLNENQKEILNLVLKSNNIEDFLKLRTKIEIDLFKYLPINMMLLQAQLIKNSSKLNLKEKAKLSYSTFMQLFCIFVEENLSRNKMN